MKKILLIIGLCIILSSLVFGKTIFLETKPVIYIDNNVTVCMTNLTDSMIRNSVNNSGYYNITTLGGSGNTIAEIQTAINSSLTFYNILIYWANLLNKPTWNNYSYAQINAQNNNGTLVDVTSANSYITITGTTNKTATFQESVLNSTIATALLTTYFNASSFNVATGTGSGVIAYMQTYDNIPYNVSEVASDIDFYVNFTGITDFNQLIIRYQTIVGETLSLRVYLWDYDSSIWEGYATLTTTDGTYNIKPFTVFDPSEHISGGIVQLRMTTTNIGGSTDLWNFDWIELSKGVSSAVGTEIDPLSIHRDGTIPLTGNWGAGAFNITASTFLGNLAWSYLTGLPTWNNYSATEIGTLMVNSTIVHNSQIVGLVGNWTLDKSIYQIWTTTKAYIDSIGNWTADKSGYQIWTTTKAYIDSVGNWTADKVNYALDSRVTTVNNSVMSVNTTAVAALPNSGGTMTGNINMTTKNITNINTLTMYYNSTVTYYYCSNATGMYIKVNGC